MTITIITEISNINYSKHINYIILGATAKPTITIGKPCIDMPALKSNIILHSTIKYEP
uniref:Uncharacterized protein n=1 Tax=Octopus bimaculoides TaxID=37653 RepID=A0A0L8I511_OCTBM